MNISLSDAAAIVDRAISRADAMSVPMNIAVVDGGGHLIAFARMDKAILGSIDIALAKAKTSILFNGPSENLREYCKPEWRLDPICGWSRGSRGGQPTLTGFGGWVYTVCGVRCPAGGTMRRSHCLDPLGGSCGHRTAARRPNEQVPTPGLRRRCRWGRRGLVAR